MANLASTEGGVRDNHYCSSSAALIWNRRWNPLAGGTLNHAYRRLFMLPLAMMVMECTPILADRAGAESAPSSGSARHQDRVQGSTTPESSAEDEPGESTLRGALQRTEFALALRGRVEWVDDDRVVAAAKLERALATTLRTEISVATSAWRGFSIHLAAEDVSVIGSETFNNVGAENAANGRTDRAVVADPEITEVSQAFLELQLGGDADDPRVRARLGRQEINLGRQRFLGAVGWRQNHQEFDAVTLDARVGQRARFSLGWLDRVHTVTGDDLPMNSAFLRAEREAGPWFVSGYSFWLDYDSVAQEVLSSHTAGARGEAEFGGAWRLAAELARQSDHGDQPGDFALDYRALEVSWKPTATSVAIGAEWLEGDGVRGFRTPLATLHKFNGFADRFLATPADGLEDIYLRVGGTLVGFSWSLRFHHFEATENSTSFGDEVDFSLSRRLDSGPTLAAKAAWFSADDVGADVVKAMVWASWGLSRNDQGRTGR